MKLELRQWIRKQRMFLILLIAALMGIVAPLSAYYSDQLIEKFGGGSAASIQLPSPTWDSLMTSYFQSTEQVSTFYHGIFGCGCLYFRKKSRTTTFFI